MIPSPVLSPPRFSPTDAGASTGGPEDDEEEAEKTAKKKKKQGSEW
jgi:hypothetical protein